MCKGAGLLWSLEHVFAVCTISYQNYLWTEACAVRQGMMVCFVHAGGKLHPGGSGLVLHTCSSSAFEF